METLDLEEPVVEKKKKPFKPHTIKGQLKQVISGDYVVISKKRK